VSDAPTQRRAAAVWVTLLAPLAITAYGLTHSDVLRQHLWPHALAVQAALLAGLAALGAATCMRLQRPSLLQGWRGLLVLVGIGIVVSFGATPTLAAGVVLAACLIAGHLILRITGADIEDLPIVAAIGIAATTLLLVGAGVAHLPMPPTFWLFLGAMLGCALLAPSIRSRLAEQFAALCRIRLPPTSHGATDIACAAVILFETWFLTANAAMPERYYDALAMHLLIPTQVLTFGHWNYDPGLAFAFFPIGADYLFAFATAAGGELTARLVNLAALLLSAALLHDIVRPCHGARLAHVTVALFLSIPVTLIVTASLFVENTLCLLTTAAVRLLLLQRRRADRAALVGLAIVLSALPAVKLHGVLVAVSATTLALWGLRDSTLRRRDWTVVACVAAIAGALGSLTYVYAWARTGNPVFPLMNDIFRSPYWPPIAFADNRYTGHFAPNMLYRMTFDTQRYLEAQPGALGVAFILLLVPGLVATLLSPIQPAVIALIVAGFYLTMVLSEEQYVRYLYPVFPLLLVLCAHGLAVMAQVRLLRPILGASVGLVVLLDISRLPSAGWILGDTDLRALFDPARRQTMLRDQVPERLANDLINAIDVAAPRVIYASDPYGAFLRGTPIYTNWYNPALLGTLAAATSPEQVHAAVNATGATFAVVNTASSQPIDQAIAHDADQYGRLIATIGRLRVYRIGPL
jgi:hypothetical protein